MINGRPSRRPRLPPLRREDNKPGSLEAAIEANERLYGSGPLAKREPAKAAPKTQEPQQ